MKSVGKVREFDFGPNPSPPNSARPDVSLTDTKYIGTIVDVQHALRFDLEHSMTSVENRDLFFLNIYDGYTLWSLLSRYFFT